MRSSLAVTASLILPLALGACSFVDMARYSVAEFAGRLVVAECMLSHTERTTHLAAVNGWLATNGRQARATAPDCDGDGLPDPESPP